MPNRRFFLLAGPSAAIMAACSGNNARAEDTSSVSVSSVSDDGTDWMALSEEDWKARLTDAQFYILRKEGTERPFTSPLNDEKRKGVFHCAGCDLALFDSDMKYDSGTGWPSFWTHIDGAMETKSDNSLFMRRTEYHCARCGGHQGHVFEDGPKPTRQRWCNNGDALTFKPA